MKQSAALRCFAWPCVSNSVHRAPAAHGLWVRLQEAETETETEAKAGDCEAASLEDVGADVNDCSRPAC